MPLSKLTNVENEKLLPRFGRRAFLTIAAASAAYAGLPAVTRHLPRAAAQDAGEVGEKSLTPGVGSRYFAASGHNLSEPFQSRWDQSGGEAVFGIPISEERYATGAGGVLQSFQNVILLYDPTQAAPFDVRGQPLGKGVWAELSTEEARQPVASCIGASCQHFPETSHTLSEPFASFWNMYGGSVMFGPPVTEPFLDPATGTQIQIFENAVLENRVSEVALRPMGTFLMEREGLVQDAAFVPAPPNGGTTYLVKASDGLRLRSGAFEDASMVALLPDNSEFIAAGEPMADWTPGYAEGFSGWVSSSFLYERPPLPQLQVADWDPTVWQGATLEETNLRREPTTQGSIIKTASYGEPVTVVEWLKGEEVFEAADLWAKNRDGSFVYARNIGRNAPVLPTPIPADAPTWGKWVDVNLVQQLATAYDGTTPLRTVVVTTGMAGWETPPGIFSIVHRVANETMNSGAIGAENFFRLDDVLFTQYFTDLGHALHFAWWRTKETIGRPGSHGCVNMLLDDARFFWDWAELGTPVYTHY